jgi:hypothetical protein
MKILEKNLLKLGFKKEKVSQEESGDKPFHYFTFEIGDLCLITCSNDECVDDSYTVEFFDYSNSVIFTDLTVLENLINILNTNKK